MNRYYIAIPYSDADQSVIDDRMRVFCELDTIFANAGMFTMSPVQKHFSAVAGGVPGDWNYWQHYSIAWLSVSNYLLVIMLDGWDKSVGVRGEIEYAREHNIPILYFTEEAIRSPDFIAPV